MLDTVGLVTLCKDINGEMIGAIENHAQQLTDFFSKSITILSRDTSKKTKATLEENKFKTILQTGQGVGDARRNALQIMLKKGLGHILLCDLDRSLQWIRSYPEELMEVKNEIPNHNFLILGRTERALKTHPEPQRFTEELTNRSFRAVVGLELDLNAAARGISMKASEEILKHSRAPGFETDVEWPLIIKYLTEMDLRFKKVEGLEYETILKFVADEELTYKKCMGEDPETWKLRATIALNMINNIAEFKKTHANRFSVCDTQKET